MVIEIMFNLINLMIDSYSNILCISVDIATVFDQRSFSSILFFDTNTGQCGDHEHSHRVCGREQHWGGRSSKSGPSTARDEQAAAPRPWR